MSSGTSHSLQISLFRSQIRTRSFGDGTLQLLESLLVSKDVKSLVEVRSALTEFMRDESLQIFREISEKSVEYKLLCTDFLIRVFGLIGDVQSCLSLRYEAFVMREQKATTDPRLQVSCTEWLTFAEHLLDHGFYSIANKACKKALLCIKVNHASDPEADHFFHNAHLIEKIKKLKDVSALLASSRSVQAQAVEYSMQKTVEQSSKISSISNETQCSGSSRFRSGIRQNNLWKLREHQCRKQTYCRD
ncbi:uncharacterized protein LOC111384186 isoform X1 [Olea europaea subsp. europaea]|uniref:Uncharacterized protein LOC111384186 isoform X1 n=2 Tax=Olea europaea subsp. europaea TaxID=158383 RepID=A0A8S0SHU6_OLEEU|nr:uncharacterized protein LOC111384186 isoform X1 [Olea europaea subsp. europaea]